MVFLSSVCFSVKQIRKKTFLDKVRIYARGGGGGQGHPKYGGQGGRGGHVYVVGHENTKLKQLVRQFPTRRFIAGSGANSKKRVLFGELGKDLHIPVPVGIVIRNDAERVLGEINAVEDKVLVAKGGPGGGPSNGYLGHKGHAQSVTLDLKLIADIGLVGFPNAGKSTLLSALSRAAPKIASYPFTTVQPQIGTMEYEDFRKISVADLPGLIEGAHVNIGMGHSFLKHVERTKLLLFVVDVHGFRLGPRYPLRSALENILLLNKELELYKDDLVHKPAMIVVNKTDIEGADVKVEEIQDRLHHLQDHMKKVDPIFRPETLMNFSEVIPISAKKGWNTDYLKDRLRVLLDLHSEESSSQGAVVDSRKQELVQLRLTEHSGSSLV